jgi:hypothetical protein
VKTRTHKRQITRQDPVRVTDRVSYYERRDYVEVQLVNLFGMPVIGRIPWASLIDSAKRCRPEEFQKP